jgi:hypothetical protein
MAKVAEKCSLCMLSRHVVHLGILKWTRILKLDKSFKSFKEFESQLKHYQDAKFIQMYRSRLRCLEWNHIKCVGLKIHALAMQTVL